MLTVAADAATAAREVDENGGGLLEVFAAARQAAVSSLWRTPDLLRFSHRPAWWTLAGQA